MAGLMTNLNDILYYSPQWNAKIERYCTNKNSDRQLSISYIIIFTGSSSALGILFIV